MSKYLLFFILLSFVFLLPVSVKADVVDPLYWTKVCAPGEVMVECNYKSEEPFGLRTYDDCAQYKYSTNYRYLAGEGHSLGGSEKYCVKPSDDALFKNFEIFFRSFIWLLLITLIIEFIFLFLVGVVTKWKTILVFIWANVLSLFTITAVNFTVYPSDQVLKYLVILIEEISVVLFEFWFIAKFQKDQSPRRIFICVLIANIMSFVLGGLFVGWLQKLIILFF